MSSSQFFVFPGQGSQYSGMGKDWFENFKIAQEAFEEASDHTGLDLKKLCFEGSEEELARTEITQPAILTATVAAFRSLEMDKQGVYAGHSLGEYSALVCAGALSLGEAAKLVNKRGKLMQEAVPQGKGGMLALIFKPGSDGVAIAEELCALAAEKSDSYISVANYNTAEQIVVSGEVKGVEALQAVLAENKNYPVRKAVPLKVSAPFHCALMKPTAEALSAELKSARWAASEYQYIANVDAQMHSLVSGQGEAIAERLVQQIDHSVRWVQSMQLALEKELFQLVEVGPGAVLSGMAKRFQQGDRKFETRKIDRLSDFQAG